MANEIDLEKDRYVNLSNIAALISFSLLIAIIFALVRLHFYYQVLLHVPIFQYIDASELVLMTPATGIIWFFYLGSNALAGFLRKSNEFSHLQKWIFQLIILSFGLLYLYISYMNDPIIREVIKWPWHYKYWYIFFTALILFIIAFNHKDNEGPAFFRRNKFILPLFLTIWYALFEGWANYEVLTTSKKLNNIIVKTKSGVIKTDSNTINAGRTKGYWFFYNRKTQITRVIKVDDIEIVDFKLVINDN